MRGLVGAGLLVQADQHDEVAETALWGTYELGVQRLAGRGVARSVRLDQMPGQRKWYDGVRIPLTSGGGEGPPSMSLSEALKQRRSSRAFGGRLMTLHELAALLTGAAAVMSFDAELGVSFRPYPSGGGGHPLEIYVVPFRVQGLQLAAHHFDAFDPALIRLPNTESLAARIRDAWGASSGAATDSAGPAAVLLLTACFARTMWKYQDFGLATVYKDAGARIQTLHLKATALGLTGHAEGGGPEYQFATDLGLDPVVESYVASFLVGPPASVP